MKKIIRVGTAAALLLAALGIWWCIASNYDYRALSGTYIFRSEGTTCILNLRPDETFSQEVSYSDKTEKSQGRWHRFGEGHVEFSSEFLKLPGEELDAAGHAHGQFAKALGIFPTLILAPIESGPKFRRSLLY